MNKKTFLTSLLFGITGIFFFGFDSSHTKALKPFTNSIGMKMIFIENGSFLMGAQPDSFHIGKPTSMSKDAPLADEQPAHRVTISKGFYMSETEVTIRQYRQFRKEYSGTGYFEPYATGISWNEALAFCKWLSKKEGKPYRLPTEAEWEYAYRAGSGELFWSGHQRPQEDTNPWGLKNMASGAPEWCYDWLGAYPDTAQTDPVGYDNSWGKVIRGGAISTRNQKGKVFGPDTTEIFYYAANRSSLPPDYPKMYAAGQRPHFIGFRVVLGELPQTAPAHFELGMAFRGVSQRKADTGAGPSPDQPYFKSLPLISSPPDLTSPGDNQAVGLDDGIIGNLHSGGVTVCPNGDLLYIAFSSQPQKSENATNTTMVATRRRYGSQEWEMPSLFYSLAGLNDQSALLWNDNGNIWFFGGGRNFGNTPFRYTTSQDNGASWSAITFPEIKGTVGDFAPQPINSAFRGPHNTIYFGSDGSLDESTSSSWATSFLWASDDDGNTWYDTGGRTAGRHTSFVMLKDGRILGMGGKDSNIEGYMPQCFSSDLGKTWTEKSQTPFAALGSNQRPVIIRLKSGNLFMAGDFQNMKMFRNPPPAGITERGAYAALSTDNGKTWKIKKLPSVPPHQSWKGITDKSWPNEGWGTLGYCTAVQSPNGIIHLLSSKSQPAMEFEMNEAWILSAFESEVHKSPGVAYIGKTKHFEEKYPNGQPRLQYSGWIADNGEFLRNGKENWYYENGQQQYEAVYHNGRKTALEKYWNTTGHLLWTKEYTPYNTIIYTTYWNNGNKKSQSTWSGIFAHGPTTTWDKNGNTTANMTFYYGRRNN